MSAPAACPVCGHTNPPGSRFCSRCGTQLDRIVGGAPAPSEAAGPAQPGAASPSEPAAGDATPPSPGAGPDLPPPPGGPVTITHRGASYAVGYGDTFYGVWSLQGGSPLERFERTDEGWLRAWERFQQLDAQIGGKRKRLGRG